MRIAIVSGGGRRQGGAGAVAALLASLLRDAGAEVTHFVATPQTGAENPAIPLFGDPATRWLQREARRLNHWMGWLDLFGVDPLVVPARLGRDFDLVHLHDTTWTFSPLLVSLLAARYPLVWTLHDSSPFTGGCISPLGCERLDRGCGRCPQVGSSPLLVRRDGTRLMRRLKRSLLGRAPFQAVTPSHWLAEEASRHGEWRHPPVVVPNSIDGEFFRERERAEARRRLGLPPERFVVALCAVHLSDRLKGVHLAVTAIRRSRVKDPLVLIIGSYLDPRLEGLETLESVATGFVADPDRLADHFAAADLLLVPTLAESFGNTVLEAMACATPVVAFASGGVAEIVAHDETGWLCPTGEVAGLTAGIDLAFDSAERRRRWGEGGRARAAERFSQRCFLEGYMTVYRRAIETRRATGGSPSEDISGG